MKIITTLRDFFQTIRFINLFIICLSQLLVRYTIILPILELTGSPTLITDQAYLFIVLATCFIAAGGYVINDYYDSGIDAINKPYRNKIGVTISKKTSIIVYILLTLAGLISGWYFGYLQGIRYPLLVFLISAGLLYFYSSSYKKMFLAGNLVVSFLAALTIGISILFDKLAWQSQPIVVLVLAYSVFAFMMTLTREIIKDCEDASGDAAFGASTFPVIAGVKAARITSAILALAVFGTILYIQVSSLQWQNKLSFIYTSLFIQAPLLVLAVRTILARSKQDDHRNSILAKIIMVTGLLSMIVFQVSSN